METRTVCVIAHVDHGKTSLTDALAQIAGKVSKKQAGSKRVTDTNKQEQERGITIFSVGLSFQASVPVTSIVTDDTERVPLKLNLIDSPGHIDFNAEVTAAQRVTDGAITVIDAVEGVCVQTKTVLRQALHERVRPVLFINKVDRMFGLKTNEEMYQCFVRNVESVNAIIGSMGGSDDHDFARFVSVLNGSVGFGSGLQQWGFTLQDVHEWIQRSGVSIPIEKLWGDWYFDRENKVVSRDSTRGPSVR